MENTDDNHNGLKKTQAKKEESLANKSFIRGCC